MAHCTGLMTATEPLGIRQIRPYPLIWRQALGHLIRATHAPAEGSISQAYLLSTIGTPLLLEPLQPDALHRGASGGTPHHHCLRPPLQHVGQTDGGSEGRNAVFNGGR